MSIKRSAATPLLAAGISFALSAFAGSAAAQSLEAYDALSARSANAVPRDNAAAAREFATLGVRGHRDERLGAPSFLWIGDDSPAQRVALRAGDPVGNARAQLKALAPLYALDAEAIDALEVYDTQRMHGGAQIVRLRQFADGIEVFRDGITLLSDADGRLVAVSGYALGTGRKAGVRVGTDRRRLGFLRDERDAIARVLDDHGLDGATLALPMQRTPQRGAYSLFTPASPAQTGDALALSAPLRTKPVWFRLAEGLVPAWYVESRVHGPDGERGFAHVVSAKDGALLFRHDLVSQQQFTYRVWATQSGDLRPLSGPQGNSFIPHPTGVPDGSQPPFIAPILNTLQNSPFSENDPWLPAGATVTTGNNIDAYADRFSPDGFSAGDERATTTAPGIFDRVYDVSLVPASSSSQIQAAVTSLFYTTNWLHDAFYDAGFDEIAGNAQTSNYGRGGIEGDVLLAEAQDSSGSNNANMLTPADGGSPRMQMFVWSGIAGSSARVNPGNLLLATNIAPAFGPTTFDVLADIVATDDGSTVVPPGGTAPGTITDGCQPPLAPIVGRIALVDRGGCSYGLKAQIAQEAGAVGLIVANNVAGTPPSMTGTAAIGITIGSLSVSAADGSTIRNLIANGSTNARLRRTTPVARDGTLDNGIVSHEWGHYISNRLIGNAAGLSNLQGGGMGEGWGDFHALMTLVADGMNWDGVFGRAGWARGGPELNNSYYYGGRRYPYSTDMTKAPLTLRHIQDSAPLPIGPPMNPVGNPNSQVHNTGNNWANMLWECYAALLKDEPRLDFEEAQRRMRMYLVGGYKLTPNAPTILEARDAVLATMAANDPADFALCAAAFAKRGAGFGAIAPPRNAAGNEGVTESFSANGTALDLVEGELDDQPAFCDFDGVLDGGETGTLSLELRNAGFASLAGATLDVSSTSPGVSFPAGTQATLGASLPFEEIETGVPVAYAPVAGVQTIQFDVAWSGPALTVPGNATLAFRVNTDEVEDASATDDAEVEESAWTPQLQFTVDPSFAWRREAASASSHHFHGPDAGAVGLTSWVSPPLQVSPTAPLVVTFRQRHQFEFDAGANYDGGVIELSTNDGATWSDVGASATPGYNGTLSNCCDNPIALRPAYTRQSAGWPAFQTVTLDLGTAHAGQTVRLRFAIGTDAGSGAAGWDVDDIVVSGIVNTPFPALVADRGLCVATDVTAGDAQSTLVNTTFAQALSVRVVDAEGDEVDDVAVRFQLPASGASARFPGNSLQFDAVTDEDGVATAPAPTANAISGRYEATVLVGTQSVTIDLANVPAAPPSPDLTSDSGFSATDDITNAPVLQFAVACADHEDAQLVIDGFPVGVPADCAGGSAAPAVTLAEGTYAIASRLVIDVLGGPPSSAIAVVVDRSANAPQIVSVTPSAANSYVVSGSAEPGGVSNVTVGIDLACISPVALSGQWSCTITVPGEGSYEVLAQQTDRAGNISPMSATFVLGVGGTVFADGFEQP